MEIPIGICLLLNEIVSMQMVEIDLQMSLSRKPFLNFGKEDQLS